MMQTLYEAFGKARKDSPDLPFLAVSAMSGEENWTYEQAGREIDRLVARYDGQGWGAGHRVALGVGNHPRHFFHFLALNRVGASVVPLNPDHQGAEIRYTLAHSKADLVVATAERAGTLGKAMAAEPSLAAIPLVAEQDLQTALPAALRPSKAGRTTLDSEAAILYTSGTSGLPKGCILTNEYVLAAGAWYRDLGGLLTLRQGQERLLVPLPVFHMNCGMLTFATVCLSHNCLILPDRFHASTWWEDAVKSRATAMHYLGIMPPALLKQGPSAWEKQHQMRFGVGAGCDPTLHGAFEERFGFPLVEVWGMTETGRTIANNFEPRQTETRAFGRATGSLEARVAADDGADVADGQSGELLVRTAGDDPRKAFFAGYLDNDQATEEAWRGGWFHTGDVVWRDASGMLYFVDRRKDMIRRSGENISASEVEAVLAVHPDVVHVAILPVPDEMRDEEVLAVIKLASGTPANEATARALVAYCLGELAYYKAPGWVVFRDELPVTATNKLQKGKIFAAGVDPRSAAIDCRQCKKRPPA